QACDAWLKAVDLLPSHAPTLRRLISYYYRQGDFSALIDLVHELESFGEPLGDAAIEAGLGIALGSDEARGTVVVAVAPPPPSSLAEAISLARVWLVQLDGALRVAARALGGGDVGRATLTRALEERLARNAGDLGARRALARLCDLAGEDAR